MPSYFMALLTYYRQLRVCLDSETLLSIFFRCLMFNKYTKYYKSRLNLWFYNLYLLYCNSNNSFFRTANLIIYSLHFFDIMSSFAQKEVFNFPPQATQVSNPCQGSCSPGCGPAACQSHIHQGKWQMCCRQKQLWSIRKPNRQSLSE